MKKPLYKRMDYWALCLTVLLLYMFLCSVCFAQFQQKPMLGQQIDWSNPLSKGLVGLWLFNERSGNIVKDLSGNGVEAVFVNSPTWVPEGLNFQGTSHILLPTGFGDKLGQAGTIVCGLDVRGTTGGAIFDSRQGGNNGWDLGLLSGVWEFVLDPGTQVIITEVAAVGDNFVAGTYDGALQKLYVNGIEVASAANSGTTDESGQPKIGNILSNLRPLGSDKTLKWIYFYNRGLSASEIAELYREPFGMFKRGDIELMAKSVAEAPPAGGGQVIMIQMSAIPLVFIVAFCFVMGRKNV